MCLSDFLIIHTLIRQFSIWLVLKFKTQDPFKLKKKNGKAISACPKRGMLILVSFKLHCDQISSLAQVSLALERVSSGSGAVYTALVAKM